MGENKLELGALITLEGGDGAGKGTQATRLAEKLTEMGLPVRLSGFPMYKTPTGQKVADYLNGKLGLDVGPDEAGLLYQQDRVANVGPILEQIAKGGIDIEDRYVESNSGHQGGKLPTYEERIAYILKNAETEYGQNGLPIPDLTILLTLEPELAQAYVDKKMKRTYTNKTRDIHEADPNHLRNANESFLLLKELYPERVHHVNVTSENGREMLPVEEIHLQIMKAVRPLLQSKGFELAV